MGVGEYYLFVVREVVVPSFHHVSRWCTCFCCSLRLGWSEEGKPVLSESEEQ